MERDPNATAVSGILHETQCVHWLKPPGEQRKSLYRTLPHPNCSRGPTVWERQQRLLWRLWSGVQYRVQSQPQGRLRLGQVFLLFAEGSTSLVQGRTCARFLHPSTLASPLGLVLGLGFPAPAIYLSLARTLGHDL